MSEFDQWNNDKKETKSQEPKPQDTKSISQQEQASALASEFHETPKQTSKKRVAIWGFGVAAFAVIAVIAGIFFFTTPAFLTLANSIQATTLSPKDYYQKIEKRTMDSGIDVFTKGYNTFLELLSSTTPIENATSKNTDATKIDLTLTLDPSFSESLDLGQIKPFQISSSLFAKEKNAKSMIEVKYGDSLIGTFTNFLDFGTMETFFQWKELNEKFLHFTQDNLDMQDYEDYLQEYNQFQQEFDQILTDKLHDFPITEELLNTLLKKYSSVLYTQAEDVKREKNATLEVNGVKKNYTKLIVTFTSEDIYKILTELLNELEQDKDILALLNEFEELSESEYKAFINLAKVFLEQSKPSISSSLDTIDLVLWVNKYGYIIGRELKVNIQNETFLSVDSKIVTNSTETAYEFAIESFDTQISLNGSSKTAKDSSSGFIELSIKDGTIGAENFQITYDELYKKNNSIQGNLTASTSLFPNYAIKMECSSSKETQTLSFSLMEKDASLITLAASIIPLDFVDFDTPSENILSADTQMDEYLDSLNYTDYRSTLAKAFSVSEDTVDEFITYMLFNISTDPSDPDMDLDEEFTLPDNIDINLPEGVTVDQDGYYSYELSTEEVKNRGEESSGYTYLDVTIEEFEPHLDTVIQKYLPHAKKQEIYVSNRVSGIISEDYTYETTDFVSLESWLDGADCISILYDTYNHKIISINIELSDQEITENILFDSLKLLEPTFTQEQRKTMLQEIEKDEDNCSVLGTYFINYDNFDSYYSASITAY